MLVTFSTPAYADITMFGEVAVRFLELMGHSGTVPGALLAEDVGTALRRLEAAVAAYEEEAPSQATEEENDEPRVSLGTRAFPLIELLRAAENEKVDVMWVENT
jgi:hypothetical protein